MQRRFKPLCASWRRKVDLVEFLNRRTGCTQYYFEYSSDDYIEEYERRESLEDDEIGAEFGIALEIISGCATKMLIRTTDNDVTVPLHFEPAIDPLDVAAIKAFMITAMDQDSNPATGQPSKGLASTVALRAQAPNP